MVAQLRPVVEQRPQTGDAILRALVDQAVAEIVATVLPRFTEAFGAMITQVNAQPPTVHVDGPATPTITVEAASAPSVTFDTAGMVACLTRIEALLGDLLKTARAPVTTDVARDPEGNIRQTRATRT